MITLQLCSNYLRVSLASILVIQYFIVAMLFQLRGEGNTLVLTGVLPQTMHVQHQQYKELMQYVWLLMVLAFAHLQRRHAYKLSWARQSMTRVVPGLYKYYARRPWECTAADGSLTFACVQRRHAYNLSWAKQSMTRMVPSLYKYYARRPCGEWLLMVL